MVINKDNVQNAINDLKNINGDIGNLSDGYHTFNELYHHRAILFAFICNQNKDVAWKSLFHSNPEDKMYDGMFIVGINTPFGQVTYHYDIDPYWRLFKVKEVDRAPEWDGSTPQDCIDRMCKWSQSVGLNKSTDDFDDLFFRMG